MKPKALLLLSISVLSIGVLAAEWELKYKNTQTTMAVYSAGLGDPLAPTAEDSKVAFHMEGAAARDLFDRIGPDLKNQCSSDPSIRVRAKDNHNLECVRYSKNDYSCRFGFDLKSGKSVGGSIC